MLLQQLRALTTEHCKTKETPWALAVNCTWPGLRLTGRGVYVASTGKESSATATKRAPLRARPRAQARPVVT